MSKLRGVRLRLALWFGGAVLAALIVFSGVVSLVMRIPERGEAAAGESKEDKEQDEAEDAVLLWRTLSAMALASPLMVAGAFALGLFLAGRALKPLQEANQRAKAASASGASPPMQRTSCARR